MNKSLVERLRRLLKDIGWHIKDDTEEYIIWKFEV